METAKGWLTDIKPYSSGGPWDMGMSHREL